MLLSSSSGELHSFPTRTPPRIRDNNNRFLDHKHRAQSRASEIPSYAVKYKKCLGGKGKGAVIAGHLSQTRLPTSRVEICDSCLSDSGHWEIRELKINAEPTAVRPQRWRDTGSPEETPALTPECTGNTLV